MWSGFFCGVDLRIFVAVKPIHDESLNRFNYNLFF